MNRVSPSVTLDVVGDRAQALLHGQFLHLRASEQELLELQGGVLLGRRRLGPHPDRVGEVEPGHVLRDSE